MMLSKIICINFDPSKYKNMLYQLENLNSKEKDLVLNAPALVTILIAGADNQIDESEKAKAYKVVSVRAFSEKPDLKDIYGEISLDFDQQLDQIINTLPSNKEEREKIIVGLLSELSGVFGKVDLKFAKNFKTSLVSFAHRVANASGGVWGLNSVSDSEKEWLDLPMIVLPADNSSNE